MKYLIIGASAAGISAAKTLRKLCPNDSIEVISRDMNVHSRCMLHHFIDGRKNLDDINFSGEDFFEKYNVNWIKGHSASRISTEENEVVLDDETKVSYDKLLIASGANYIVPPIGDFRTAKNVFGLRDIRDAEKISQMALHSNDCVVVGSGLVGLDAAYALTERGIRCHVVEMADRISPLQLDYTAAAEYQRLFEEAGCVFHLSSKVVGSKTDGFGNITVVLLESGNELKCDFVVMAAGVRPAVEFLSGSGIEVNKAVTVDCRLKTNIANVWAAGDVAGITGIWPNAVEQGEIAARNMAGQDVVYENRYGLKNTMNFYGLTTLSLGTALPSEGDTVCTRESHNRYMRLITRDNVVTGIIIQGDISNSGFWQELVKNKINIKNVGKSLFSLGYADFYDYYPEDGSYKWNEDRQA